MQNRGYSASWLQELRDRNNIVDVIGKYVHLTRRGSKYWACCPFHNEKTPSFMVSEDIGLYYCFGCKESGDVVKFVMKFESCDFMDACRILAKNANMELPIFSGGEEVLEQKKKKDRLIKLLDCACKHYQENLYTQNAKPAQEYIKKRGFKRIELENFKLGYSINWDEIVYYLKKQGFTVEEMMEAGIVNKNKSGNYYDIYAHRLVFPIINAFNECVGFSARVLVPVQMTKYINTPETMLFQKRRVVYGINLVKQRKQQIGLDRIIIVEGQIDVIAMHRAGFTNTVACMGTALTIENARELKKLSRNVTLCFDGDTAGTKATIKSIDILRQEGFDIRIVSLPDKHDPDEILKLYGQEYLQNLINGALPTTDYLINVELKNYDLSKLDEKGKFVNAVLGHIRKLETDSQEDIYLEKVRDLSGVPIDILRRDLYKIKKEQPKEEFNTEEKKEPVLINRENGNIKAIKFILSSLIFNKEFVDKKIDYKKLLPLYVDIIDKAKENIEASAYYDYFDVDNNAILKDCLNFDFNEVDDKQKYFNECLWTIAKAELEKTQKELTEEYKKCEDNDQRSKIMVRMQKISSSLYKKNLEEFYVR